MFLCKDSQISFILSQITLTGSVQHRAQVTLYSMMMSEKYDRDIEAGLLYYMRTGHLQSVGAPQREKRALILKRNEIARFLSTENQRSRTLMPSKYYLCII